MAEPGEGTWWRNLDAGAKTIISLIGVASALIGVFFLWDKGNEDRHSCTFSGAVFSRSTGRPLASVRLGYDRTNPANPTAGADVVTLAQSGPDGAFSGNCRGVPGASFELLATGGPSESLPGLPCLRTMFIHQKIRTRGATDGLRVTLSC